VGSKFGGDVKVGEVNADVLKRINETYKEVSELMQKGATGKALHVAFDLVNFGNKYFDECKPWISVKDNEAACRKNIFEVVTIIANLAKIFEAFIPFGCAKIQKWLGVEKGRFELFMHETDFTLPEVEILYKRRDMKEVLERFKKYV
jgi:methionyl-tRNA synthetase